MFSNFFNIMFTLTYLLCAIKASHILNIIQFQMPLLEVEFECACMCAVWIVQMYQYVKRALIVLSPSRFLQCCSMHSMYAILAIAWLYQQIFLQMRPRSNSLSSVLNFSSFFTTFFLILCAFTIPASYKVNYWKHIRFFCCW